MEKKQLARIGILCVVGLVIALSEAVAIPTFARRYATSCATCHQAFPRLNAVGESFRISGYRFVDDERYRKTQPVELGDDAYKKLWPKALWPTDIPSRAPLSFITRFMVEADLDGSRPKTMTYLLPEEIELVWAGNLGENLLFYGDVIFLQKDFGGQQSDSWATLKAWVQFQDLFGAERWLNLRLGTVGTQTMGLFTARDANFYGTHFYLYTTWSMPTVDLDQAGLSEFKGNNFTIGPQTGIEVNGYGRHWFYALGLVDGDPATIAGMPPSSDVSFVGMSSGEGKGDLYGHVAYKIGGMPFDRSGEDLGDSLSTGAESWRDDSFTLSLFGYMGTASIKTVDLAGNESDGESKFWRLGIGAQQQISDVSLSAAYLVGDDDNPYLGLSDEPVASRTWHAEVLWFAYPWLMPYARYEGLDLDMPENVPGLNPNRDITRGIIGAKFLIRPNVFCVVEGAYYTKGAELEEGFDQTLFMLLGISF